MAGVTAPFGPNMPTTSPRDSISVTIEPAMSWSLTAMPIFSGPASTVKLSSLPASLSALTVASKAAVTRLLTSTLPAVVCDGKRIEPFSMPLSMTHLASAAPPIAAAAALWPVWLMPSRS